MTKSFGCVTVAAFVEDAKRSSFHAQRLQRFANGALHFCTLVSVNAPLEHISDLSVFDFLFLANASRPWISGFSSSDRRKKKKKSG